MTATNKIVLSPAKDIPFNKLVLSQSNVRRTKAGVSVEALAESISRRSLLQSLTVRPVLDGEGQPTGTYEVPAGGRRFRALELLVRQKRLAKTAPVPCVVKTDGIAEEDSLAENVDREPLHPLDQFRAFQVLHEERGQGIEEIAAAFAVTPAVVRQRLKLVSASPRLLELYAEDQLTLDHLIAFCISGDHARQEQVWEALSHYGSSREPHAIRRMLTEGAVRPTDKRVKLVGAEAYEAAGGVILRDLFTECDEGLYQDPAILDRLVREALDAKADEVTSECWKWVEAAPEFPYGRTWSYRRIVGAPAPLSDGEHADREALRTELDTLEQTWAHVEELPSDVEVRLAEIECQLKAYEDRPLTYEPDEIARAGAMITLDYDGTLKVERGFVRKEDDAPQAPPSEPEAVEAIAAADGGQPGVSRPVVPSPAEPGASAPVAPPVEEEEPPRPLSDRLVEDLTSHRTIVLRNALAADPELAYVAVLHAVVLGVFYRSELDSCLEIAASIGLVSPTAVGITDTAAAGQIESRHQCWREKLPHAPQDLWAYLVDLEPNSRANLLAHAVGLTVNGVKRGWEAATRRLTHADQLAQRLDLDMGRHWTPTVAGYLGAVTKAQILEAVREAKGEEAALRLSGLKKAEMAQVAERELEGSGWVPPVIRTPPASSDEVSIEAVVAEPDAVTVAPEPKSDPEPVFEPAYAYPLAAE